MLFQTLFFRWSLSEFRDNNFVTTLELSLQFVTNQGTWQLPNRDSAGIGLFMTCRLGNLTMSWISIYSTFIMNCNPKVRVNFSLSMKIVNNDVG